MKVLIEIDEKFYQWVKLCGLMPFITQGKVIPNNATNGDVLKIIFPDGIPSGKDSDDYFVKTDTDWWDAPYKGGE